MLAGRRKKKNCESEWWNYVDNKAATEKIDVLGANDEVVKEVYKEMYKENS